MLRMLILTALLLISFDSKADFLVLGEIKANTCSGFVLKSCSFQTLTAISVDGKMRPPFQRIEKVTDYKKSDGRCWIKTSGDNMFTWALHKAVQPDFYTTEDGRYKKISPEYLTFKCRPVG